MHDGMQCDPIQDQGQGRSRALKVGNPAIFKSYLLCHLQWELTLILQNVQTAINFSLSNTY